MYIILQSMLTTVLSPVAYECHKRPDLFKIAFADEFRMMMTAHLKFFTANPLYVSTEFVVGIGL